MRVSTIEVANFRCFADESSVVDLPEGLVSIVGENNAGKSTLLDVVEEAVNSPTDTTLSRTDIPLDRPDTTPATMVEFDFVEAEIESIVRNVFRNQLRITPSLIDAALPEIHNRFGSKIRFQKRLHAPGDYRAEIWWGDYRIQDRYVHQSGINNPIDESQFLIAMENPGSAAASEFSQRGSVIFPLDFQSELMQYVKSHFVPTSDIRVRPSHRGQLGERIIRSFDGSEVASLLHNLIVGGREGREKFAQIQTVFSGFFPGYSPEVRGHGPEDVRLAFSRENSTEDVNQQFVGTGVIEVLTTIVNLISLESSVFVLEEPESHLHRLSQAAMMRLLQLSATKNQVIVLTHSPSFIDLGKQSSIVRVRRQTSGSTCFTVPLGRSAGSREAFIDALSTTQAADLLFARAALIVEGQTELEFFRNLGPRLGLDLEAKGVAIVDLEGDSQFRSYIKICESLEIPMRCLQDLERGAARGDYSNLFTTLGMEIEDYWREEGLGNYLDRAASEVGSRRENKVRFGRWMGKNLEVGDVPNLFIELIGNMLRLARDGEVGI